MQLKGHGNNFGQNLFFLVDVYNAISNSQQKFECQS